MFQLYLHEIHSGHRPLWGIILLSLAFFMLGVTVISSQFQTVPITLYLFVYALAFISGFAEPVERDATLLIILQHYVLAFLVAALTLTVCFASTFATGILKWNVLWELSANFMQNCFGLFLVSSFSPSMVVVWKNVSQKIKKAG